MPILINATVLSNFAAVERVELLHVLWETLYLAYSVYEEVQVGLEEGYGFLASIEAHVFPLHFHGWLRLVTLEGEEETALFESIPAKLHRGEATSLAIAAHRGWRFLTDDRAARRHAERMGVSVAGTLGVLARLVRQGTLTLVEANDLLGQMIVQAEYRSPTTDLRSLVAEMEEE